jgi:tetratricopeptide (TPR) repeat protein
MAGDAVGGGAQYWAFISYSHNDALFGRRLHRRLENYILPRRLTGRTAAQGLVPRRLVPIFRDREELPAANDLSAEVRAALRASRSLIVVCSPSAAASKWVAREIEAFRELHPDRPVLAAVREGEPAECFPQALRQARFDGEIIEPLAADFRRGRDGEQLGLLKLVAGMIGIGLDELVQRDAQRRSQRVTAVTAGALAAMLVMVVLTAFALNARSEAERQRGEAEGLIGFMSTDLRYKLRGVGRLDIMTAVNERALQYFDREQNSLTIESRARRARVLQAIGEDDENRGDLRGALNSFKEAGRTTAALYAEAPNVPERIFDQAQTEFWFGKNDYDNEHFDAARSLFEAYKRLTSRLVEIQPNNPVYQREVGYAEGNLCAVALRKRSDRVEALRACAAALQHIERAAHSSSTLSGIDSDLINRYAWLADSYLANGDIANARTERLLEETMLERQMKADPQNMNLKESWVAHQLALARIDVAIGARDDARARLVQAKDVIDSLIAFDPANRDWSSERKFVESAIVKVTTKIN